MSTPKLHFKILKDGKCQYSFEKAKVNGKRNRVYKTCRNYDEALREGNRAYQLYYSDGITINENKTYNELAMDWLEYCKNLVSESTIDSYAKRIRNQILPYIGDKYLKNILTPDLVKMLAQLNDKGLSRNSLTNVKALLTSTFRYAVEIRWLTYDPTCNMKLPSTRLRTSVKTKTSPHHFLPDKTMYSIFSILKDNLTHYLVVKLGYECGLRRGEIFGLFWNDVDFTFRTITIRRQMQYSQDRTRSKEDIKNHSGSKARGDGYWYYKLPKYDSIRTITISNEVAKLLREYKDLQLKNRLDKKITSVRNYVDEYPSEDCKFSKITQNTSGIMVEPVFVKENGEFETPNICMYITAKVRKGGVKNFDMHSLRKTHSTILQNNGFNIKYVADRLGHTDVKTTTQVYYELSKQVLDSQNSKLDDLFEATSKQGLMEGTRIVSVKEVLDNTEELEIDDSNSPVDDKKSTDDSETLKKMEEAEW